jgi:hypothetical protein
LSWKTQAEVLTLKQRVEDQYMRLPGVTGMDVGLAGAEGAQNQEYVIRIYVANKRELPKELVGLKEIEGVPVEVVERRFELH